MWVQGITDKNKEHANKTSHLWPEVKGANRNIQNTATASLRRGLKEEEWERLLQHCFPLLTPQIMHSSISFTAF